jgi:hypothetical protein
MAIFLRHYSSSKSVGGFDFSGGGSRIHCGIGGRTRL